MEITGKEFAITSCRVKGTLMNLIQVAVQAYMLALFPQILSRQPPRQQTRAEGLQLESLARGLALPSFWTSAEINDAFAVANRIWAQAAIEFRPVTISRRAEVVPADESQMWICFVNRLSPRSGIAVAFVYDLPSNEGGWGGGRIAAVAKAPGNALEGFSGRILAHELGHVLFDSPFHTDSSPSNLMFGQRHPRVVTADLLEPDQITRARTRAQSLR
jgi:hypothetical protein